MKHYQQVIRLNEGIQRNSKEKDTVNHTGRFRNRRTASESFMYFEVQLFLRYKIGQA